MTNEDRASAKRRFEDAINTDLGNFIKASKSSDLPPIFNEIRNFNTNFIFKITEISKQLQELLGGYKNLSRNDTKIKEFENFYTEAMNYFKTKISEFSKALSDVTTIMPAKRQAKELLLYLVDDIYISVYEKLATDINSAVTVLNRAKKS